MQKTSEAIEKIERFIAGFDTQGLSEDEKTFDAVVRNLEVIGEAIKKMPEDIRAKYPTVEWRKSRVCGTFLCMNTLESMSRSSGISFKINCRSNKLDKSSPNRSYLLP